jgi:ubiquinone biosynthesis protein Coq4
MTRVIDDALVEPVTSVLVGATDVDGGPTDEQRRVLHALVAGYWGRPDIDVGAIAACSPSEAGDAITDHRTRRRVRELMVLLELCRHPISAAQVERVEEYAGVLGESGPGLEMARDLVRQGVGAAQADFQRFLAPLNRDLAEQSLRDRYPDGNLGAPDHELATRLRALHDLPPGTIGHEYVEFYRRNGLELPGDDPHIPAVFVSHDMCHVIGGYEPVGIDEIALGAMQLAIADTDAHWMQLLGNLGVHEAGFLSPDGIVAKQATLARPGAAETMAHAMWRGSKCTGDFTGADHLGMATRPLEDVRAEFGVPPRER